MALVELGGRRVVLASASPRRAQLLTSVGVEFEVVPADIDESPAPGETPERYVARLSQAKAATVAAACPDAVVIAADTTVDVDDQILEKPRDDADRRRMLQLLSGRAHLVHTGVTVIGPAGVGSGADRSGADRWVSTIVVTTSVTFVGLTESDVEWYAATGDGDGKAGGYGIQGAAGAFVERVEGSVTNVIGLPLAETLRLVRAASR